MPARRIARADRSWVSGNLDWASYDELYVAPVDTTHVLEQSLWDKVNVRQHAVKDDIRKREHLEHRGGRQRPALPGRPADRVVLRAAGVWDEAIVQYRATIVQAFSDVADALAAQARLAEQRMAQEAQVTALREAMELSLDRYRTGLSTYLELLDAEELLYPAETSLAQTQRDQLLAVVNLYKALGGGWQVQ